MKFSIIIPFFDNDGTRTLYLNKCIESLVNQKFKDFEVIIIGKDLSLNRNINGINFINIKFDQYLEWSKMMNFAVEKSSGEFLQFWQSDFIVYPSHFKFLDFYTRQFNTEILYTGTVIDVRSDENRYNMLELYRPIYHYYDADHLDACIHRSQFQPFYEGFTGTYTHWYVEWLARMWKKLTFLSFKNLETIHLPHGGKEEQKHFEGILSAELYQKCTELDFNFERYSELELIVDRNKKEILKLHGEKI